MPLNRVAAAVRPLGRSVRQYSAPADGSIPPAKQRFVPSNGYYPKGFLVGSAHAGVKPSNKTKDDVAIVAAPGLTHAAAVFTKNTFKAAPVVLSQNILGKHGKSADTGLHKPGFRGVVINSGCANAVTGDGGYEDAQRMSTTVDQLFSDGSSDDVANQTLVMSTGVIGQRYVQVHCQVHM